MKTARKRKLFCEISPLTYRLAVNKNKLQRWLRWQFDGRDYVRLDSTQSEIDFPVRVYQHKSLMRRKLGEVDPRLQENKANNLGLATKKVDGVIIQPGQTFSFWQLVGACTRRKGYLEGLIIKGGQPDKGIGGGMCQFTNLIHWLVLHSPLTIVEHHHHNQYDLFPDYNRQIPFGTGTSIMHNYLDYVFTNPTDQAFQLLTKTDDTYLCGELRCQKPLPYSYKIVEKEAGFSKQGEDYYRTNRIYRITIDKVSGQYIKQEHLISNYAKVMYDPSFIRHKIKNNQRFDKKIVK